MSDSNGPYEASSGYVDSLQPEESTIEPPQRSGNPGGIARQMAEAMSSSEFSESQSGGITLKRQGRGLHISYENSMELLGFSRGDV